MPITDFEAPFHVMVKESTSDPEGGNSSQWIEGEAVCIAMFADQSVEAQKAMKLGVSSVFTALIPTGSLKYDSYVRRDDDKAIFRVISSPSDYRTPSIASFQRFKVTMERTELPS